MARPRTEIHARNLALAKWRYGHAKRVKMMQAMVKNPYVSNAELRELVDLKERTVVLHIKTLRESGMITTVIRNQRIAEGYANTRTVTVTKKGLDAICQNQVSLEGSAQPGSESPSLNPEDHEDLL